MYTDTPVKKHKIAVVGLGCRGKWWTEYLLTRSDVEVTAVCDVYEDRVQDILHLAEAQSCHTIRHAVCDYRQLLSCREDIEIVLLITSWEAHIGPAVDFLEAGIITAMEVGGAYSLEDCWRLVETQEKTQTPFFFMENCCYGKRELMILNMVRQGLFGEIVHCSGSYAHDLREEIAFGDVNRHYRLRNYRSRNCENYPTHELGPIARVLGIGHGNRMIRLTSTASKSAGLAQYLKDCRPEETDTAFAQGDIVNTLITCANGETILLTLDTTLPRSYSRGFQVRGTKGMYLEDNDMIFLDQEHHKEFEFNGRALWGNAGLYEEAYLDDLWKNPVDTEAGHGGMDGLMLSDFLRCVEEHRPMPIDVYDAASWMCISCLSEQSIREHGAPVSIPDFRDPSQR